MRALKSTLSLLVLGLLIPVAGYSQERTRRPTTGTASSGAVATTKRGIIVSETSAMVGARLGYINVEKMDSGTLGMGASYDYAIADNLLVGATFDYWREDYNIAPDRSADVSDMVFGAHTKLMFTQFNLPVRPFGMLGLTMHRIKIKESRLFEDPTPVVNRKTQVARDTRNQLGVDIGGGVAYGVNQDVDVTAELQWRNILEDTVDYDQVAVTGGLTYLL